MEAVNENNYKEKVNIEENVNKPRFQGYKKVPETSGVLMKKGVLFGDCKDVRLSNAKETKPIKSEGGTITFTRRFVTSAVPGTYIHGKVYIASQEIGEVCTLHLIHHESVNGEKIGKYLSEATGMENFRLENVWNRYDWCEFRNWGSGVRSSCCEEDCSDDECCDNNCYCWYENNEDKRSEIHFVSFSDEGSQGLQELGRFTMPETPDVIHGDWFYGARLTDANGDAYAYIYGDCLVVEALLGEPIGKPTEFSEPIDVFY